MRVLVTGADGFIGRAACRRLRRAGHDVRAAVWEPGPCDLEGCEITRIGAIGPRTEWAAALVGVRAVVHLAARVHVMDDREADPLRAYRTVNAEGTGRLAEEASRAGVGRIVFVSTIKVNGERTTDRPFTEDDVPAPEDPYGLSKLEGEEALRRAAKGNDMDFVILRLPLVYGPGVRANFERLLRMVDRGWPLPLGRVANRRSFIGRENVADLLARAVDDVRAAHRLFLVSDGDDVSTPELIRRIARSLGRPVRLWPVPIGLLRGAARLTGRQAVVDRLCGSLVVDSTKVRTTLDWTPPCTMEEELKRAARAFRGGEG